LLTITPPFCIAAISALMQRNTDVRKPSMVLRQAVSVIAPIGAERPPLPPLLNA
jgi:hypothetical protein